jgi:hypothetical protein
MKSSSRLARPAPTAALIAAALTVAALTCVGAGALAFGASSGASATSGQAAMSARTAMSARMATSARMAAHTGADTFLAEGQNIGGTALYEPACRSGCVLSGDATSILHNMTWRTWTAIAATGAGTEKIEGCVPNCAGGGQYRVPVVVTFSRPVKACPARTGTARTGTARTGTRWFWSRASFSYPRGLPKALRGARAPTNPWTFTPVIAQARESCG